MQQCRGDGRGCSGVPLPTGFLSCVGHLFVTFATPLFKWVVILKFLWCTWLAKDALNIQGPYIWVSFDGSGCENSIGHDGGVRGNLNERTGTGLDWTGSKAATDLTLTNTTNMATVLIVNSTTPERNTASENLTACSLFFCLEGAISQTVIFRCPNFQPSRCPPPYSWFESNGSRVWQSLETLRMTNWNCWRLYLRIPIHSGDWRSRF